MEEFVDLCQIPYFKWILQNLYLSDIVNQKQNRRRIMPSSILEVDIFLI